MSYEWFKNTKGYKYIKWRIIQLDLIWVAQE